MTRFSFAVSPVVLRVLVAVRQARSCSSRGTPRRGGFPREKAGVMGKATRHIIIFFGKPKGRWKRVDLFMILYSLCPLGEILSYELCGGCKIVVLRDQDEGLKG